MCMAVVYPLPLWKIMAKGCFGYTRFQSALNCVPGPIIGAIRIFHSQQRFCSFNLVRERSCKSLRFKNIHGNEREYLGVCRTLDACATAVRSALRLAYKQPIVLGSAFPQMQYAPR